MTDETEVPRRRASDGSRKLRIVTGWVGVALATLGCLVGIVRENNALMAGSFLAALVSGNVVPFAAVKSLMPWGKGRE